MLNPPPLLPVPAAPSLPPPMPDPWPRPPLHHATAGDFLQNIQGNILKGHGRPNACLIFWQCDWSGARPAGFWSEVFAKVTSAASQKNHALLAGANPDEVFRSFALTAKGMIAMAVNDPPEDPRKPLEALRKNPAVENPFTSFNFSPNPAPNLPAATPDWAKGEVDCVWQIACNDLNQLLTTEVPALIELGARFGLTTTATEKLLKWRDGREPFGFRDGISVPGFFQSDVIRDKLGGPWATMPLEQVLIGPGVSLDDKHEGGALHVLQKFEQDVAAFRKFEADSGIAELGSLLVGRTRDGEPLAPRLPPPLGVNPQNSFDFETDPAAKNGCTPAMVCPFHAHIRKMNTRTEGKNGADGLPGPEVRKAQLVRRGMVFDPDGKLTTVAPWPTGGVGLMFMAYTANIETTFNQLFNHWVSDRAVPSYSPDGADPILGGTGSTWAWASRGLDTGQAKMPAFVQALTPPLFLYVPSLNWLGVLAGLS